MTDPSAATANRYSSIDGWEAVNQVYKEHLLLRESQPRGLVWIFVLFIPLAVAVIAMMLHQALDGFFRLEVKYILEGIYNNYLNQEANEAGTVVAMIISYALLCTTLMAIAVFICYYFTPGESSRGFPVILAHLNGVHLPHLARWKQIPVKFTSTLLAVAAGIPIGYFGVLAEIGASIGACLLSGHGFLCFSSPTSWLQYFRNPRDVRLVVTVGLAAGIAAAFLSPIGGLAMVLELLTVKFSVKFSAYVFMGCIICAFLIQIFTSYFLAFKLRGREGLQWGELFPLSQQDQVPLDYAMVPATIFFGIVGGVLSAAFTFASHFVLQRRYLHRPLVILGIVTAYSTSTVLLTFAFGGKLCHRDTFLNGNSDSRPTFADDRRTSLFCSNSTDPEVINTYSSLAASFPDSAFRFLIARRTDTSMEPGAVAAFFCLSFVTAAYFAGVHGVFNGDVVLPGAVLGASAGRLIHAAGWAMGLQYEWFDAGLCALISASAFLGGLTRLTFSLAFLMIDIGGDVRHLVFNMLAISIARVVASAIHHDSLDEMLLKYHGVPYLDNAEYMHLKRYNAVTLHAFQLPHMVMLPADATVLHVHNILVQTSHNAFPVVNRRGEFLGLILRSNLELLLWRLTNVVPAEFRRKPIPHTPGYDDRQPQEVNPQVKIHDQRPVFNTLLQPLESVRYNAPVSPPDPDPAARPLLPRNHSVYSVDEAPPAVPSIGRIDEFQQFRELDLWLQHAQKSNDEAGSLPSLQQAIEQLPSSVTHLKIGLRRYVDRSTFVLRNATVVPRMYDTFNILGLRHLVVVDYANRPVGIITRMDLMGDVLAERKAFVDDLHSIAVPRESGLSALGSRGKPYNTRQQHGVMRVADAPTVEGSDDDASDSSIDATEAAKRGGIPSARFHEAVSATFPFASPKGHAQRTVDLDGGTSNTRISTNVSFADDSPAPQNAASTSAFNFNLHATKAAGPGHSAYLSYQSVKWSALYDESQRGLRNLQNPTNRPPLLLPVKKETTGWNSSALHSEAPEVPVDAVGCPIMEVGSPRESGLQAPSAWKTGNEK